MSQPRQLKVKVDKSKYPFEEYANNPHEVEEKDLITYIYVPVK
jgi:DNA gyrase inhibitor GyrI